MANLYSAVVNSGSKRTASTVDAAKGRGGYEVGCCHSTSRAGEGGIDGCGGIAGWGGEGVRGCSVEGGWLAGDKVNGHD